MNERPLAYICSPLQGNIPANVKRAAKYCRMAYDAGYLPIAPHVSFTPFLDDENPIERKEGMAMGLQLLKKCRVLIVCGSKISSGMDGEISEAKRLSIPIFNIAGLKDLPPVR